MLLLLLLSFFIPGIAVAIVTITIAKDITIILFFFAFYYYYCYCCYYRIMITITCFVVFILIRCIRYGNYGASNSAPFKTTSRACCAFLMFSDQNREDKWGY